MVATATDIAVSHQYSSASRPLFEISYILENPLH